MHTPTASKGASKGVAQRRSATKTKARRSRPRPGTVIDRFEGIAVYYNGPISRVWGRNRAPDGYNLGLKYQCVEFVKRYYYYRLHHRMPDAGGNAVDFFNPNLADGAWNPRRGLYQFRNGSHTPPRKRDILVFGSHADNPFGHVALVAEVFPNSIEMIQQNGGPDAPTRVRIPLLHQHGRWFVHAEDLLGWLGKR